MTRTERHDAVRDAAIAAGYAIGLVALTVGTTALATETTYDEAAQLLLLLGAAALSFAAGYATRRYWILAVPGAIASGMMVLVFMLLASGFPSYDNDPRLGLYALIAPLAVFVVLGGPMALGVAAGRHAPGAEG
jgi:hypothetical protein